jgi:hypothetical protein
MAITRIGNPAIADQRGVNFRNIIINGDQSIAQRSTSTSSANTSAYHCTDRWNNVGMSIGTWTISQSTDVPTGQGFAKSLKYDCTTAEASPSAGDQLHLSQRIEGQNLQYLLKGTSSAKSLTLSFWVKTNKTGTYQVNLRDKDNTRIIGKTYAVSSADTWEKKILTFAGDTTGAFDNDNASSLECEWFLGAGSTYTSGAVPTSWEAESAGDRAAGLTVNLGDSTSNEWYITGVQLEAGQVASDFEFLPHDVNFQRCLRYYEAMGITTGGRNDTNRVDAWCQFKVKKRSEAYSASVDTSGGNEIASVGIESHDISSLHSSLSKQFNGAYLRINTDNDFTAGQPLSCYLGSTAIRIDDEL